jgi:hypothetical protein
LSPSEPVLLFSRKARVVSDEFPITVFHKPACGTSRNSLAMIEAAGYAPTVIEYLKVGWTPGPESN